MAPPLRSTTPSVGSCASTPLHSPKLKLFIIKNFLPLAFLTALALALAWPVPGRFLAQVTILGNVRIVQVGAMARGHAYDTLSCISSKTWNMAHEHVVAHTQLLAWYWAWGKGCSRSSVGPRGLTSAPP